MARIMGLYEEGTLSVRQAFKDAQEAIKAAVETVKDRVGGGKKSGYERVAELQNGAHPTKAELRAVGIIIEDEEDEDDEEGGSNDEDEPP